MKPKKNVINYKDEDFEFFNYLKSFDNQQNVLVWKSNLKELAFGVNIDIPDDETMLLDGDIFNHIFSYKPISPLSLNLSYYPTIVRGQDEQDVFLFINHDSDDENFVYYIDPKVGKVEKSSIENLSIKYNNFLRDDFKTMIDFDLIDQIVVICFDLSSSMNLNPKGEKVKDGEMSRFQLSKEFIRLFIDESKKLKNSSIYGLVSFGNEIKINRSITAISSEFLNELSEVNQTDDKKLLF